ncbi:amino acid ABC transporter substrate-binding protein, PAAT family [Georgenia satyanarayanai]|uniref:Amino acid ABC transporter substrate-binding protein, PAAT family n=1 Tax=Georgenia satyanarayanai TaxID=860221 RepID=A0A2Y9ACB6_9MICO|nr:glutamate ABC transporter substrate-binding protein [Georgenia satyanarayanai]PYF99860.1 amino acid ABC transporter substrate-binding protein (PAAT family) [Georgenia satyanarayanai]SSA41845.1 amino acid ABC transporter substrate-binding protein, PAAT family [Georgenia satyanarayanai]
MRKTRRTMIALAAAGMLTLSACGDDNGGTETEAVDPSEFPEGSTMARIVEEGTITIGTKFDQPLFGLQGPDGVPVGFDVEIGQLIADSLGVEAEFVEAQSAQREQLIENGAVDIVVATYTINDDRKELIDFAGPYYVAGQSLMVAADNTDINGPDDLAGKTVCSADGSTPAQNIRDNYPDAELVTYGAYTDCLDPLSSGQVDAVTTDNVILAGYVDEQPDDFKLVGEQFTEEPYGIGLAKGDDEFRTFINDVLEEAYDDGRWAEAWENTAGAVLDTPEPPEVDRY